MNKFYPFYFHFYTKKTTRDFGLRSFFVRISFFCEVIYIGNQPHFE